MAAVGEVCNRRSTPSCNVSVVINLDSDEEGTDEKSENVNYLFDRFILSCRPHLEKEAIILARQLFKEAPTDLVGSNAITDMLKRYTKEIKKDNAFLYMDVVCKALGSEKRTTEDYNKHNNVNGRRNNSVQACDVTGARDFKGRETIVNGATDASSRKLVVEITEVSDDEGDFICEIKDRPSTSAHQSQPSTSTAQQSEGNSEQAARQNDIKFPRSGKMSTKDLSTRQKKRLVIKLKRRLKEISQEIEILNKSELTLEEMEMADSNYIKENRLKKKFDKTWNKLCKILGRAPNTGRVVEKRIRPSSTGYSIIDKAVGHFMKDKQGKFPDYFDIRDVVLKVNKDHDLRMSSQVLNGIIADVFTDIGNKLQRLREKDLVFNFGSHLLDDFKTEEDPALLDMELSSQLEKNRKISKKNLKQVYAKFTHLERYGKTGKKKVALSSMGNIPEQMEEGDNISSDVTTTDEEQEISRTDEKEISSVSDEDFVDSGTSCSQSNDCFASITTEQCQNNTAPRTVDYVSLESDKESNDTPSSRVFLSNEIHQQTYTATQQENPATSTKSVSDDCQIIIDEPEESCILNQIGNASVSVKHNVSVPDDKLKPNIGNLDSFKTLNTSDELVESPFTCVQNNTNQTGSRKRKASNELPLEELHSDSSRLDKVVFALKRKKLKAPNGWTKDNSTEKEVKPVVVSKEPSLRELQVGETVDNESSSPVLNGKPHIHKEQIQKFRERTLNGLKLTRNVKGDRTVNGDLTFCPKTMSGACLSVSPSATKDTSGKTTLANHHIPVRRHKPDLIIID